MSRKGKERRKARRAALFAGKGKVLRQDQSQPEAEETLIASDAKHIRGDMKLISDTERAKGEESRGIPRSLARKCYEVVEKRIDDPDVEAITVAKLMSSVAQFGRADIETGRYEKGEPANTVNVNQMGVRVEQPASQGPTPFQKQMTSILASILPPSVVDGHVPAGGDGQAGTDEPAKHGSSK